MEQERELFRTFAALFRYPDADIAARAREGEVLLAGARPAAAIFLGRFAAFAHSTVAAKMQELYTSAFDLQALCAPYLGYQLCGEDARRGLFLMKLQELYRAHGFEAGRELPDHLAEVLSFLAQAPDCPERQALIEDGLRPATETMAGAFTEKENPYGRLMEALRICLESSAAAVPAGTRR
jgi:nitrate reductase molybdenum cofactor assembly chaperone NarJ/NarW